MYVNTKTHHEAIAQASAKIFEPIYFGYRHCFPDEVSFYERCAKFVTFTFNQKRVTLNDRTGLGSGRCAFQDLMDRQDRGYVGLNAMNSTELLSIAEKLKIIDAKKLHRTDLIFNILDRRDIKHDPILQRPIEAVRPKPHPLKVIEHFHFMIAKACLGSNLIRKLRYQPILIAHLDFEGTRRGASVDPLTSEWIHAHGVMLVRPEQQAKFDAIIDPFEQHLKAKAAEAEIKKLNNLERHRGLTSDQHTHRLELHRMVRQCPQLRLQGDVTALDDIKVERYCSSHPLAGLMGYASKGADQVPIDLVRRGNRVCEGQFAGAHDLSAIFPSALQG